MVCVGDIWILWNRLFPLFDNAVNVPHSIRDCFPVTSRELKQWLVVMIFLDIFDDVLNKVLWFAVTELRVTANESSDDFGDYGRRMSWNISRFDMFDVTDFSDELDSNGANIFWFEPIREVLWNLGRMNNR